MTTSALNGPRPAASGAGTPSDPGRHVPRVVVADRGDALVPHLTKALTARFDVVGRIHAELTPAERLLVAASTFRPTRRAWVERFFKSSLAVRLRSRLAERQLAELRQPYDVVFQTHALFSVRDRQAVLYVDCTHRQSADQWPGWNPLRGRALQRWYDRERRQYHAAAHVFAFSHETERSLVEHYGVPADRVSRVGAGLNFGQLPPAPPPRTDTPPTVLFVGNDFERKGGPVLLEAFRIVRKRLPQARLLLVGEPHGIVAEPGVEVLGRIGSREELSEVYAGATVFCLPTVFDPFGLVVLEAMAHRLPCVVTPTCGLVEVVEEGRTGRFLDSVRPSAESLAAVLVELLTDPETCDRWGAAGRRRVEEEFLWPHVVERMAPVLDRLARGRGPGTPGGSGTPGGTDTPVQPAVASRPADRSAAQAASRPADRPADHSTDRPAAHSTDQPTSRSTSHSVVPVRPSTAQPTRGARP